MVAAPTVEQQESAQILDVPWAADEEIVVADDDLRSVRFTPTSRNRGLAVRAMDCHVVRLTVRVAVLR